MPAPCCWANDDTEMFMFGLPSFVKSFKCGGVGILSPLGDVFPWWPLELCPVGTWFWWALIGPALPEAPPPLAFNSTSSFKSSSCLEFSRFRGGLWADPSAAGGCPDWSGFISVGENTVGFLPCFRAYYGVWLQNAPTCGKLCFRWKDWPFIFVSVFSRESELSLLIKKPGFVCLIGVAWMLVYFERYPC